MGKGKKKFWKYTLVVITTFLFPHEFKPNQVEIVNLSKFVFKTLGCQFYANKTEAVRVCNQMVVHTTEFSNVLNIMYKHCTSYIYIYIYKQVLSMMDNEHGIFIFYFTAIETWRASIGFTTCYA